MLLRTVPRALSASQREVLGYGHLASVEDEAAVPVGHRPGQLLGDFGPSLAVDCLALAPVRSVDNVLGHPSAVLAAGDGPLSVAPLAQRYSSFFGSSPGFTLEASASLRMVRECATCLPLSIRQVVLYESPESACVSVID